MVGNRIIESILKDIGLTNYESKIYLTLLENGKSTSGEILKNADLKTGKIYEILESLKNKGLVSEIKESGVRKFFPADPRKVNDFLRKKKEKLKNQEKEFNKIIPDLQDKINSKKEKAHIEVFFGKNGLKTAFNKEFDYDKKGGTVRVFGIRNPEFYDRWHYLYALNTLIPKREKSGVNIKKIYSEDARDKPEIYDKGAKIRYIEYSNPVIYIVVDKLIILCINSHELDIAITIESKPFADVFIEQFDLMWSMAKE